jgi:anaerobic magnesium-protoporphyrin IX monomethyl ester cyclase
MRNKVLLIYPKFYKVDFDAKSYPLGLLSIGTILKQHGFEVKLIDFLVEDNSEEILQQELNDDVLAVGISAMTPQISSALEISALIKKGNKDVPVIWGGIHATLFPDQTIKNSLIDYVMTGEAELSFPKLLKFLQNKEEIENVSGLIYQKDGQVIKNPETELVDLNDLPILDYSLLSPKTKQFDSIILNTSRGCPYRCTFCVNISLHNRDWRYQKADKVLEELEYLVNDLGYKKIKFQEDNFFVNRQRVIDILDGIESRNLKFEWLTNCRVDYFRDDYINDELLGRLKKSGCYKLAFGAESGSQRILDCIKKDIKIEQIIKSAEVCHNQGVRANYSFMCALPDETKGERIQTLKLIDRLLAIGPEIEIISPQPYRPYPGDELARQCEAMGFKFPEKLEDWPAVVAKSLDSSSSNLEDFPWIKNPNEIRLIRVVSMIATLRKSMMDYVRRYPFYLAPFIIPFYLIEKLRWKFKYFGFPIEYTFFIKIYWLTQKLRKNRLFSGIKK